MKKLLVLLTMLFTLASATVCFASDGSDLNKQQKAATTFIDAFDGEPVPAYTAVSPLLSAKLNETFGEKGYDALLNAVKEKIGNLKEAKFFTFQRFDQADRVIYLASFSKEKSVVMIFQFDKQNKLTDFAFNANKPAENQEKK